MEKGFPGVSKIASHLNEKFGTHFIPQDHSNAVDQLTELLSKYAEDFSRSQVMHVVESVIQRQKNFISWENLICIILGRFPGSWQKLVNNPGINASTMFLLTDGSVLCQASNDKRWRKLTPDGYGDYINGTWTDISPSNDKRLYYASAILSDGRLIVSGGEYEGTSTGTEGKKTEIYDPVTDVWTEISAPTGWSKIGDAPCCLLSDGRLLIGNIDDSRTAIYDPVSNIWTDGPHRQSSSSSEESWVLLPDNTVITVRCDSSQRADKYVPATNSWVDAGTLPQNIIEISSSEIGGAVALPDGRAFFVGATGHTAIYSPPLNPADPGTWSQGPDFPTGPNGESIGSKDAPACLMTSGKVLIAAGPINGRTFMQPTYFYEFNGTSIVKVADPPNSGGFPYKGRMLLLPNGQILFGAETDAIYAYSYFACPRSAWRPTISSYPSYLRALHSYTIYGTQFNGLSQAVGYGDDAAAATNYPLVKLKNISTGRVYYCRTYDHSTMAIATGSSIQSTQFAVPFGAPQGDYLLYVVANGIPSLPVQIALQAWRWPFELDERMINILIGSLADGNLWVLTKTGPHPVDPWGPEYAKLARKATENIKEGFLELQQLGDKAFNHQIKTLAANPAPLVDESKEDEEDDEKNITVAKKKTKQVAT